MIYDPLEPNTLIDLTVDAMWTFAKMRTRVHRWAAVRRLCSSSVSTSRGEINRLGNCS